MKYCVKVTFRHWIDVEADSEDEAFELADGMLPTFTSCLEDMEMEIDEVYPNAFNNEENI